MSGAIVYAIALICERGGSTFLVIVFSWRCLRAEFTIWTRFIGAIALLNVVIIVRLVWAARYRSFQNKLRAFLFCTTLVSLIPIFLLFSILTWTFKNPLSSFIFGNKACADLINCMILFSIAEELPAWANHT